MTELLPIGAGVLIEKDIAVVPRCGSCYEPLYSYWAWNAIVRSADNMVQAGTVRHEVLEALIVVLTGDVERHPCYVKYVIEEEP